MISSERMAYSCRSTWVNGSSRAPNRDFVRRTPLPTARMRPVRRVRMVTMWSASPRSWVRSTIPSSRYWPTRPLSLTRRTDGRTEADRRAGGRPAAWTRRGWPRPPRCHDPAAVHSRVPGAALPPPGRDGHQRPGRRPNLKVRDVGRSQARAGRDGDRPGAPGVPDARHLGRAAAGVDDQPAQDVLRDPAGPELDAGP